MNFRVDIDGVEISTRAFRSLDETISDWREVWPEVGLYYFRAMTEQFESLGSRGGTQWQPLSEKYRQWKEKRYPGKPVMIRTFRLLRSFSLGGSAPDQVQILEPLSYTVGSTVPYARYHQYGTKRMPKRTLVAPTQRDIDRIVSRMYRYAERGARDAGFETTGRGRTTPGAE